MSFLPIVQRELLVASRQSKTYWSRVASAGGASALILWMLWANSYATGVRFLGQQTFYMFVLTAMMLSLSSGLQYTSDCISSEKREGTLGFLFLTTLKGYDIVFGKLCGTSLRAIHGLLAMFPVMSVLLLLGGVTGGEMFRVGLVLVNTLFLSLALGLLSSCLMIDARKSLQRAALAMMILALGLPLVGLGLHYYWLPGTGTLINGVAVGFLIWSPVASCVTAMAAVYPMGKMLFWTSLALHHCLAWVVLLVASKVLPRRWQDRPDTAAQVTWRERWQRLTNGSPAVRRAYRERLLNINPIHWLTSRDRCKPVYVWILLGLAVAGWCIGYVQFGSGWILGAAVPFVLIPHAVLYLWAAHEMVRQFYEDRRSGALELVLGTTLSLPEIFHGQMLSLWKQFRAPMVGVLVFDLFLVSLMPAQARPGVPTMEMIWCIMAGVVALAPNLYFIGWTGMWMGIMSKDIRQASNNTILWILMMPWVALQMIIGISAYLLAKLGLRVDPPFELFPCLWLVLAMAINHRYTRQVRNNLLNQFRELASQRDAVEDAGTSWRRVGRACGELLQKLRLRRT